MTTPVDAKENDKPSAEVPAIEPAPEQVIEFLQQSLNDAFLVIGQKEVQIQRQNVLIQHLQTQLKAKDKKDETRTSG